MRRIIVGRGIKRRILPECRAMMMMMQIIVLAMVLIVVQGIGMSVDITTISEPSIRRAGASGGTTTNNEQQQRRRELIVQGAVADPTKYPFFVLTANDQYESTRDNVCGGVLIHPDIVLTAAHCQGFFNYGLRMYNSGSQNFNRRTRIVEQWRHPNFNLNTDNLNWDVLVMRLEEPVYDIAPVPLNVDSNVPARNDILTSIGFGAAEFLGELANILMEGEFEYMLPEVCADLISTHKVTGAESGDELLCTGSTAAGNSICLGDSGGPLLTPDGVLVGITSWTVRCESDEIPDGFARISTVHDWIQQKICEISVDKPETCPDEPTLSLLSAVEMRLQFRYDFSPEDTTFAVRNRQTREIEYAGPTYVVPDRVIDAVWVSDFVLPAGRYNFEVYDKDANGLSETDFNVPSGYWELYARYQDGTSDFTMVASGDDSFSESSIVSFQINAAPTPSPTELPSSFPTVTPSLSFAPSDSPPTFMPSSFPTTSIPTFFPTTNPTTKPTDFSSNAPTITPLPTIPTSQPSAEPTIKPTAAPSSFPTISSAPTSEVEPPIPNSTGAFELAATLLMALFLLQGIALVRSRFFENSPQFWPSFVRAFARTPWPTVGNMATLAATVERIYGWTRGVYDLATVNSAPYAERARREVGGWYQQFSEQATVASDSVSEISGRLAGRLSETTSRIHTWCLTTLDQVMNTSIYDYPSDAAQIYLSAWYQEIFPSPTTTTITEPPSPSSVMESPNERHEGQSMEEVVRNKPDQESASLSPSSSSSSSAAALPMIPSTTTKVTDLKDSLWTVSYRFSSQPKDDDNNGGDDDDDDDESGVVLPTYSGKLTVLLTADGHSELISTTDDRLQIVKIWGWDEEYSQADQKHYLLFSMDVQFPRSDPKLPERKERLYFQARIDRSTNNGAISLSDGTVTVKKDVVSEKTKGMWGLFQVADIPTQFQHVGDFKAKPS